LRQKTLQHKINLIKGSDKKIIWLTKVHLNHNSEPQFFLDPLEECLSTLFWICNQITFFEGISTTTVSRKLNMTTPKPILMISYYNPKLSTQKKINLISNMTENSRLIKLYFYVSLDWVALHDNAKSSKVLNKSHLLQQVSNNFFTIFMHDLFM
jgi:hypothetical protein